MYFSRIQSNVFFGQITGLRPDDLDLDATLNGGQMFRWSKDDQDGWRGMVGDRSLRLQQDRPGDPLHYETDADDAEAFVRDFLRLDDIDLPLAAAGWARGDALFAEAWERRPGIRILRQDPDECFFAFLCASVAPIGRIGGMLRAVAAEYGTDRGAGYVAFPSAARIAAGSETRLRELGLGFRARRVIEAARVLRDLPFGHLAALRTQVTSAEAQTELRAFFGVGEKIADCVCLFALDNDGAIPVDTHIWRIAQTRYVPELAGKTLTSANYARVTQAFHDRFGPYAGWAQQTLFYRAAVGRKTE